MAGLMDKLFGGKKKEEEAGAGAGDLNFSADKAQKQIKTRQEDTDDLIMKALGNQSKKKKDSVARPGE